MLVYQKNLHNVGVAVGQATKKDPQCWDNSNIKCIDDNNNKPNNNVIVQNLEVVCR